MPSTASGARISTASSHRSWMPWTSTPTAFESCGAPCKRSRSVLRSVPSLCCVVGRNVVIAPSTAVRLFTSPLRRCFMILFAFQTDHMCQDILIDANRLNILLQIVNPADLSAQPNERIVRLMVWLIWRKAQRHLC